MSAGLGFALFCAVIAILYGAFSIKWILALPTGNDKMRSIAAAIQEGATAYLNRQYTTIGIVGENGAGKTTLLRIMAGVEQEHLGERQIAKGMRVLMVPQEPRLDPTKNVRQNLEDSIAPLKAMLTRFEEVGERFLGQPIRGVKQVDVS